MTFDPAAATAHYIDGLGPAALAKAAAYTTGGHWLLLWGLVVTGIVTFVLVRMRILDRLAARLAGRGWALRTWLIGALFLLLSSLLTLPWTLYQDWWRESAYGRTSQPIADFLVQGAMGMVISALLGGLFFLGLYALIRRSGQRWWLWSGGLVAATAAALLLLSPILIEPLFNSYQPVPAGPVRAALITMADQAGIPHDRIFMYDGSRQSNNFTANVNGIGSSARIAISDVALHHASLDEVRAVTGHEIGHYVLHHTWRMVIGFSLLAIALFYATSRLFAPAARAFGSDAEIGDPVGLPVMIFLLSALMLLAQPLTNGLIRVGESEADQYSFAAVNLPDALAAALVKTAEYRNPRPGPIEELIFYDHPSVTARVRAAMEWKAAHMAETGADVGAGTGADAHP